MAKYSDNDISGWKRHGEEDEGSKDKFWVINPEDKIRWLFKIGRNHTENWAEIVAAEICQKLDIPHAEYRLAQRDGKQGTISKDFVPKDVDFILAFDVIEGVYSMRGISYQDSRKETRYDMEAIKWLSVSVAKETEERSPLFWLFGYFILDALIGNTDRHHQNWGFLLSAQENGAAFHLAPTFDHGAAFCRESPEKQKKRMQTKDGGYNVAAWCARAESRVYYEGRPLKLLGVVRKFSQTIGNIKKYHMEGDAEVARQENFPAWWPWLREVYERWGWTFPPRDWMFAVSEWRERIKSFAPERDIASVLDGFDCDIMHPDCKKFALEMLKINRASILQILGNGD